jgi:acetyltransferase-like isoleucine patch superfamily enzyme
MFDRLWFERWRFIYLFRYHANKVAYLRSLGLRIGENCSLYNTVANYGSEPWLIEIGNRVTVAGGVEFLNHDGGSRVFRDRFPTMNKFGNRYGTILIHDNCFIGHNAILMLDIDIGPNSIVGAGSVVTKSVPPNTVVIGNPARQLCSLDDYIQRYLGKMLALESQNFNELRKELTMKLWKEER